MKAGQDLESNIEDKSLSCELTIHHVKFNYAGRFYIKLTLRKLKTRSQIDLAAREGVDLLQDNEVTTAIITQPEERDQPNDLMQSKFGFHLPRGFVKDGHNNDIFLIVEAIRASDDPQIESKVVGEARIPIYPRIDSENSADTAQQLKDRKLGFIFKQTDTITLQRTKSTDSITVHCGVLKYTAALAVHGSTTPNIASTAVKMKVGGGPMGKPSSAPEMRAGLVRSVASNAGVHSLPATPFGPRTVTPQIVESPIPEEPEDPLYKHVSKPGREEVTVILHGAVNLPSSINGRTPLAYATVRCCADLKYGRKAQGVTHTAYRPTHSPVWEKVVTMEIDEKDADDEAILLSIADNATKKELVQYKLPVSHLVPFHHYHLELVMPAKNMPNGIRTYVTVIRKLSTLPRELSSPSYTGLEVLLQGFENPLATPVGTLVALARIVPNYRLYKKNTLLKTPWAAGIAVDSVKFPSPHPAAFSVSRQPSHGFPQLTLPSTTEEQPSWFHPFMFGSSRDNATLFTPDAALVIEFYTANSAMTDMTWKVRNPIGFSTFLLDDAVFKRLNSDTSSQGVTVEDLPVQCKLRCANGATPTVGLVLRLITTARPDSLAFYQKFKDLPKLMTEAVGSTQDFHIIGRESAQILTITPEGDEWEDSAHRIRSPDEPRVMLQKIHRTPLPPVKDGQLPPHDAMETILPEYQYIFVDPENNKPRRKRQVTPQKPGTSRSPGLDDDGFPQESQDVIEDQLNELDNYRTALQKMGQDIITLRHQIRDLESTNSKLRRDLANYQDSTRLMVESSQIDSYSKEELMVRYITIKQKMGKQTNELKEYKEKVQKLQNEMIKKNDQEHEFIQISNAQQTQQSVLHRVQEKVKKVKKLEEACRQQEKVIEKMEKIINKNMRDKSFSKDTTHTETHDALMSENTRLRNELTDLKEQLKSSRKPEPSDDLEKLELYQAIDKAEGRIMSLEKQLADNSRQWGKERAELKLKLNEAEHGFGRTNSMVLHDFPLLETENRKYDYPEPDVPRRFSKGRNGRYGSPKLDPIRYK